MKKTNTNLCISCLVLLLIGTSCTNGFLNPPATPPVMNQDRDLGSAFDKPETGEKPPRAHLAMRTLNNSEGRTVLPQKLDPANLKDYLLTASKDGGVPIFVGTWATYAAMIADTETLIEIGFWDFFLEAQSGGQVALEGVLNDRTIVEGTNTLDFNLQEAASGTGSLGVSLYYPSGSGVQAIKAGLFNLDNTPTAGYRLESLSEFAGSGSYAGNNGITYAKTAVNRGFYILKIYLYRDTAATDQMNVYSELVRITPGCESTAERSISDLNTLFNIRYEWDNGSPTSGVTVPLSYNEDKPVTLPSAIEVKREGYTFGGWYDNAGFTGTAITGWSAGGRTGDITLYAKWNKNLTIDMRYGTKTPAQIDLVSSGSYTFTAVEKDAIQTLDLTAVFDRGTPVVTRLNSLYTPTPENISITTGTLVPIPLGYGKNTITLEFEGITYTIICYAALLPVKGTGSSLPVSVFNETNTQAAVTRIANFVASTDYTTMSTAQKTAFSPSVIAVAGTDTTSAAKPDSMIEITDATIPITLRGYGTGADAGIINNNDTATRRALQISTGACVTMEENLTLTGGNQVDGGGVYVTGTNTRFTINGGNIKGNKAYNGGGVYVASTAQFTLGGTAVISGNMTGGDGGGVYATDIGTLFTMNGGVISDNATEEGGGVYVTSGAQFTLNGSAEIKGNTATSSGGGVYVTGSGTQFTMNKGTLSSNITDANGGGVYVVNTAQFILSGTAAISYNTADANGGGVSVDSAAQFILSGTAVISDNTATYNGGGVSLTTSGTKFTMSDDASIKTNTARNDGGGVSVTAGAQFTQSDKAVISGNTAYNGGGVYLTGNSRLTQSGTAAISDNKAYKGGGVYAASGVQFTLSGEAIISGNTTKNNGGGVFAIGTNTLISVNGGTSIKTNTATSASGGGVYIDQGAQLTLNERVIISDNMATSYGGGVCGGTGGIIELGGSIKIQGNKKGDSTLNEINNIQMEDENNFLKITGTLTGGAGAIGITRVASGVVAQGDGYSLTTTDQEAIMQDSGGPFTLLGITLTKP